MKTLRLLTPLAALLIAWSGALADEDKDKEKTKPGFIGIQIKGESDVKTAVVQAVLDDSPAAKAGLKVDDVVVKINGKEFETLEEFVMMVRGHKPGDTLTLAVKRDGKDMEIKIKVGVAPDPKEP